MSEVASTINILRSSNDDSRVMFQIVASLTDDSRGVMCDPRGVIYDPRGVIYTHL